MNINDYDKILQTNFQVNSFALTLLRDGLLQNLLQEDYPHILYWAGKEIARQFPFDALASVVEFFDNAGFGHLEIASQDSKNQRWTLTGDLVQQRLNLNRSADFSLEAGFWHNNLNCKLGQLPKQPLKLARRISGSTLKS